VRAPGSSVNPFRIAEQTARSEASRGRLRMTMTQMTTAAPPAARSSGHP